MALDLVAGHAVNNLGLGNVLPARGVAEFHGNTGVLQARADDTVNIFIDATDAEYQDYEYAASVVAACSEHTVYAVKCTAGANEICSDGYPAATITENASEYTVSSAITTTTAGVQVKVTVIENCQLDGTTAATCTATVGGSAQGTKYTTSATVVYTDAASLHYNVAVTAGNDKLANPTGKCSAAAPGVSTRSVALWGLLGAVGVVGVLAL
ncbi:hypothetical protein GGR51DRAFT_554835 [Nemania sp. FL0031]|nr:hypothetical protein GGR51DRAFT_554835 [Nemania sp. FL0031]